MCSKTDFATKTLKMRSKNGFAMEEKRSGCPNVGAEIEKYL